MNDCCENTDKEVWRETTDVFSNSIHVTKRNGVGINCDGIVIVLPLKKWHKLGEMFYDVNLNIPRWKLKLIKWLMK